MYEVVAMIDSTEYGVYHDKKLIKVCANHALAWKVIDRLQHEPVNKQEAISRWIEKQILD